MKSALAYFLILYLLALQCSIAGMEIFSSLALAITLTLGLQGKIRFHWRKQDLFLMGLLAIWVAWVALGLLVNPEVRPFWYQLGFMRWTLILLGLVIALETVWNSEFERQLIRVWSGAVILIGVYAIFQCLTGIDFVHSHAVSAQGGGVYKAAGFFSISLTYAYCFGLSSFAIFRPALERSRVLGWAVILMGSAGILASMSRGAWIAALVCAFLYILARHRRLAIPLLILVVAVTLGLLWQGGGFASKIKQVIFLEMDHSSSVRVDLWKAYWQMFLDHPVFGVGIFSGDRYLPAVYAQLGIQQPFVSHAHNNLLQFLAGTGFLGLGIYLSVCGVFLHKAWRLRQVVPWGWSLFLAHLFVQVGGLTECNFIDGEVTHGLVFSWALLWMLERRHQV